MMIAEGMHARRSEMEVTLDDGIVVLTVRGHLDARLGAAMAAATEEAIYADARRLDIDVRQVSSFTDEGARALRARRPSAARLREGLHYRTGRGPGREALLAAHVSYLSDGSGSTSEGLDQQLP
ncbi:MAG TPA: hypothetical protein VK975_03810 [Acidimicrobiales bacterium]|nr:hypothetical protein [Acidimicrobiales bacterium]